MRRMRAPLSAFLFAPVVMLVIASGCGDDDGSEAQRRGVGAACVGDDDCEEERQRCLPFKAGYCGVADCTGDADCPSGSACVAHTDGTNYCFLICANKPECNVHRPLDSEANCVSNITFVDGSKDVKACVPPSS